MGILDRLGSTPSADRRARRAGLRLEGRNPDGGAARPDAGELLRRLGLLAVLVALGMLAFPRTSVYDGTGRVGDVWQSDDVVAPFDYAIRLPADEVAARQDSVRAQEPAIFAERPEALAASLARLDTLRARLSPALGAYVAWQLARRDGDVEAARQDSARFFALRAAVPLALTEAQWGHLALSALARASGVPGAALDDRLVAEAGRLSRELLARGVLDVPKDTVRSGQIVVRNLDPRERTERAEELADVLSVGEALVLARRSLGAAFPGRPDTVEAGAALLRSALEPSLVYQGEATRQRLAERLAEVQPTRGRVRQGMTVIRRGDEVTPARFEQLRSLAEAQRERAGGASWALAVLGRSLLVTAAVSLFFLYLYFLRRPIFDDVRQVALISLLMGVVVVGFGIGSGIGGPARYYVPVALVSVLLTVVFDSRVGSFATITLALVGGLVTGFDFGFAFATLFVGILAVFSVRDAKSRSEIVASAGLVFAAYALVLVGFALLRADPFSARLTSELVGAGVSAVLVLLAQPILWSFERTFGVTTDLTLLELSDTNRPLLKELSLRAPGTFNHVLQVANLAEAAADAIGANALRARVGALYHDIGKMLKPEYYIENQQPGENPHDRISPYMSALVIAAHVKDGAELAQAHRLPRVIQAFIQTHHGTALIEYFYRRAAEQAGPDDPPVDEAEFRYPGPRPQTGEEAVVMLADSVEAASRSLDKPTPRRLEMLIDGIVRARIEDGQLNASSLTFADIARIKETFLSILCGIYHFRVKYPEQEESRAPAEASPEPPALAPRPGEDGSEGSASGPGSAVEASELLPLAEPPRAGTGGDGAEPGAPESGADGGAGPSSQERATMG